VGRSFSLRPAQFRGEHNDYAHPDAPGVPVSARGNRPRLRRGYAGRLAGPEGFAALMILLAAGVSAAEVERLFIDCARRVQ
jgi:hypothetical protein